MPSRSRSGIIGRMSSSTRDDGFVKSLVDGPSGEGVAAMLLSCHEKIRRFMASAARLASDAPAAEADVAATSAAIVRYFAEALPRHAEDEDLSLRPRLEAAGFDGDLERLAREHEEIDVLLAELTPLWVALAAEPALRAELVPRLAPPTKALADLFDRHLGWEEERLVPRLEELLGPEGLAAALAEMKGRRAGRA